MPKLKSYAAKTDQGAYLQVNEDALCIDTAHDLYMVVDGIGGAQIGDRAARLVKEVVKNYYTKGHGDKDITLPFYFNPKYLFETNIVYNALIYSHQQLNQQNKARELEDRGAASAMVAVLANHVLTLLSVGNCVCYLFRHGKMNTILTPNSFLNYANKGHQKHFYSLPLNALGLYEQLEVEVREISVTGGDEVLIMSDGVYARLEPDELTSVLVQHSETDAQKLEQLFKISNRRGNLDNQSAILLKF